MKISWLVCAVAVSQGAYAGKHGAVIKDALYSLLEHSYGMSLKTHTEAQLQSFVQEKARLATKGGAAPITSTKYTSVMGAKSRAQQIMGLVIGQMDMVARDYMTDIAAYKNNLMRLTLSTDASMDICDDPKTGTGTCPCQGTSPTYCARWEVLQAKGAAYDAELSGAREDMYLLFKIMEIMPPSIGAPTCLGFTASTPSTVPSSCNCDVDDFIKQMVPYSTGGGFYDAVSKMFQNVGFKSGGTTVGASVAAQVAAEVKAAGTSTSPGGDSTGEYWKPLCDSM